MNEFKRLTNSDGTYTHCIDTCKMHWDCENHQCNHTCPKYCEHQRLLEYENTGLTPNEIALLISNYNSHESEGDIK